MLPEVGGIKQLYKLFLQEAQELPKWLPNEKSWYLNNQWWRMGVFYKIYFYLFAQETSKRIVKKFKKDQNTTK